MVFQEWAHELSQLITKRHIINFSTAIAILLCGILLARRAHAAIGRLGTLDQSQRMLFQRIAYYGLLVLATAAALDTLGLDLKVLLGAAGVLTVAIGFAAQTSASNLISGLFLMFERPFVVGNTIAVGDIRGEVIAIDLMSTKIRTFNNLMIRVPNETLVKSNITNYSYFPIRRVEVEVGVAYGSDLAFVSDLLKQTVLAHPETLREPAPLILVKGLGASSIDFNIQLWTPTESVPNLPSELYQAIELALKANGIEIPFPTQTILHRPLTAHA